MIFQRSTPLETSKLKVTGSNPVGITIFLYLAAIFRCAKAFDGAACSAVAPFGLYGVPGGFEVVPRGFTIFRLIRRHNMPGWIVPKMQQGPPDCSGRPRYYLFSGNRFYSTICSFASEIGRAHV